MKTGGSIALLAGSSLLLPAVDTLWICLGALINRMGWAEAVVLPMVSVVAGLVAFEVVGAKLLSTESFGSNVATNSPDRSYWYIVRKVDPSGAEVATTYGFAGPEPRPTYTGLRVLVIGDSIPDAGRSINFPNVAEELLRKRYPARVEVVNAAISSYSLEQIKRFYAERLGTLRHDVLVVSFYLDDINRELRYRKHNQLYTPSWPEWMQDVYYRCFACRTLLTATGFTESTFLLYRTRGRVESVPEALRVLDGIRSQATKHGAVVVVLNVPIFDWPSVLPALSDYQFSAINRLIEGWARDRGVYYHDLLPALVGRDIRRLRRGDRNIHFNDEGHRLVGAELERLINTVIEREHLHDRLQ